MFASTLSTVTCSNFILILSLRDWIIHSSDGKRVNWYFSFVGIQINWKQWCPPGALLHQMWHLTFEGTSKDCFPKILARRQWLQICIVQSCLDKTWDSHRKEYTHKITSCYLTHADCTGCACLQICKVQIGGNLSCSTWVKYKKGAPNGSSIVWDINSCTTRIQNVLVNKCLASTPDSVMTITLTKSKLFCSVTNSTCEWSQI